MSEVDDPYRSPKSDLGEQISRRWPKRVAFGLVLFATLFAIYSLYASVFFLWAADTTESPEVRTQAVRYLNAWAAAFLVSGASAVALVIWLIYAMSRGRTLKALPLHRRIGSSKGV